MIAHPPAVHAPASPAINYERLIWSIGQVESGGRWDIEGGALQFTRQTWEEVAHLLPYRLAQFEPQAVIIASAILHRNAAICIRFGVEPTPGLLASSWRHGLSGAMKRAKRGKVSDYETRVMNLYLSNHAHH